MMNKFLLVKVIFSIFLCFGIFAADSNILFGEQSEAFLEALAATSENNESIGKRAFLDDLKLTPTPKKAKVLTRKEQILEQVLNASEPLEMKTVKKIIEESSPSCYRSPKIAAFIVCLMELGLTSEDIYLEIIKIKKDKYENNLKPKNMNKNWPGRIYFMFNDYSEDFRQCKTKIFTQTFTKHINTIYLGILQKHLTEDRYQNFLKKMKPLKGESVKTSDEEDSSNGEMTYDGFEFLISYEELYFWVEKNIDASLRPLFHYLRRPLRNGVPILNELLKAPKTLKNNPFIAALSVYFKEGGVSNELIYSFILYAKQNHGQQPCVSREFTVNTPRLLADKFYKLNADTIKEGTKKALEKRRGNIRKKVTHEQCFQGPFYHYLLEVFEPFLQEFKSDFKYKIPNIDCLIILKEHHEGESHIPAPKYPVINYGFNPNLCDQELLEYIYCMNLEEPQKVVLGWLISLKLMGGESITNAIRKLPVSLHASHLITAISVFLGHLGVSWEEAHNLIIKIRTNLDNSKLKKDTIRANYKSFLEIKTATPQRYKRDFSVYMLDNFLPLLRKISNDNEAEFFNSDELHRRYEKRVG